MSLRRNKYKDNIIKGTLYEIESGEVISTKEPHKDDHSVDEVLVEFALRHHETGLYASEYKSPLVHPQGAKKADVFCGILNEHDSFLGLLAIDIKRDIMAFPNCIIAEDKIGHFIDQMIASYLVMKQLSIAAECDQSSYHFAIATRSWDENRVLSLSNGIKFNQETELAIDQKKGKMRNLQKDAKKRMLEYFANKQFQYKDTLLNFDVFLLEKIDVTYRYQLKLCKESFQENAQEKAMIFQ